MPKHLPYQPGHIYFITKNIHNREHVFRAKTSIHLLLDDFNFYRRKFNLKIYAWVIMPEHFHWIIEPSSDNYEQFCQDQIHRKGKYREAPGLYYVSKIMESLCSHSAQVINQGRLPRFWQEGFYDRILRDKQELHDAVTYIHHNPVKAGLVEIPEDYLWSSYRAMFLGGETVLQLDPLPF